jgi:hypothetical protein
VTGRPWRGRTASSWLVLAAVALPPLALAGIGFTHPSRLTPRSAEYWRDMHIALLAVFPMLGLAPWLVSRAQPAPLRWATAVLGYVYAVLYGALDALAGVGVGAVELQGGDEASLQALFGLGNALGTVGVSAYLAATLLAAGGVLLRARAIAIPGALMVDAAAVSFLTSHIYWPRGVLTMLVLGMGWAVLALVDITSPLSENPNVAPAPAGRVP